jgi:mono/diheme cytochrome c family protein
MRLPPLGTVPHVPNASAKMDEASPPHLDRALIFRGRNRFELFCATCHGLRGDGKSKVAEKMVLRPPPSLLTASIRSYPAERVYRVIANGYGLMQSYAPMLTVRERWAVATYLQVLQRSQAIPLIALPSDMRKEAEAWLR